MQRREVQHKHQLMRGNDTLNAILTVQAVFLLRSAQPLKLSEVDVSLSLPQDSNPSPEQFRSRPV